MINLKIDILVVTNVKYTEGQSSKELLRPYLININLITALINTDIHILLPGLTVKILFQALYSLFLENTNVKSNLLCSEILSNV